MFNDADLDDDGTYTQSFGITCINDFDFAEVNVYNTLLETNFGQFTFGTPDGTETNLDFNAYSAKTLKKDHIKG